MSRHLRWAGLVLVIAFASTFTAAAQDKKDLDKKVEKKDDKKDDKYVKAGDFTGTIITLGDNKELTVKVTLKYTEPNPGAIQNHQNYMRRAVEISRNPNPIERNRQMAQLQIDIANNQRNMYTLKEVHKDIALQPSENLVIRANHPPLAFDDKGNPRKYTDKELKEMRGEGNLPGYKADWDQLRTGQLVTVSYGRKKDAPAVQKGKDLDKDRELERKLLESDKPIAMMIVIVAEQANK